MEIKRHMVSIEERNKIIDIIMRTFGVKFNDSFNNFFVKYFHNIRLYNLFMWDENMWVCYDPITYECQFLCTLTNDNARIKMYYNELLREETEKIMLLAKINYLQDYFIYWLNSDIVTYIKLFLH